MGLLDKLWDDTVAGPRPESGLGKLRKFQFRSSSGKDLDIGGSATPYVSEEAGDEPVRVSRKIMIVKPPGFQAGSTPPVSPAGSTPPVSPAGSTPPISPFSGNSREAFRFRRSASINAYEKASVIPAETSGARGTSTP